MQTECLLFRQMGLRITGIRITSQDIMLLVEPQADSASCASCPACGQPSRRVHSHHHRKLQDLPAYGRSVRLDLRLRRFFCDRSDCPQVTFVERIHRVAQPHARKTARLSDDLAEIGFTAGGEAGSRLAGELGMTASGDTLLRLMRQTEVSAVGLAPQALGVDDWAVRRGQVYGTILCNLQTHRPIDLLPERSADVFANWLKQHPGAGIISRDRGGEYAKGASLGAPHAIQVADRWHLLHNLSDALQQAVDRRCGLLGEVADEVTATLAPARPADGTTASTAANAPPAPSPPSPPSPPAGSRLDQKKQQSRQRRLTRYQKVRELLAQGKSIREIARVLKLGRETVERFARCEQFPERAAPAPRPLAVDQFLPYLKQRWEEGCDNATELWREAKAKGFTGSRYMVRRQVRRWRRAAGVCPTRGPQTITGPRIIRPSARRVAWLALGHVREPTPQDEAILKCICAHWPELQETAELCRQFASLFKERDADSLEAWAQLAEGPMILAEVRRFAQVLRQDWAAVLEAVRQPWSQGPVEGQINRLKLIKRQMYGRANFDLLRQRVLHAKPA